MKLGKNTYWPALAVLLAGTCHAQSSVTLYGMTEDGLNYTSNSGGHGTFQMLGGVTAWGLHGVEDLGGNLHAIFQLESGFDINSGRLGNGGRLFGRQAYVGLESNDYGTLTLGRQYDPVADFFSPIAAAEQIGGNMAAHPYDNDNVDWDFRVNNAVKYLSPTYGGVSAEAMYAFSNSTGFASNSLYSAAVRYQQGSLTAVAAYLKARAPGTTTGGALSGDNVFTASSQQNLDAGVQYKFGKLTTAFAWSHVDVYAPTANAYFTSAGFAPPGGQWNSWKFDNFEINGQYDITPATWFGASYTYTMAHLHSTETSYLPRYHQITAILGYRLSKSTTVYAEGAWQHVASAHTGTDFDYAQTPASAGISSSENQMIYRVAMTHWF